MTITFNGRPMDPPPAPVDVRPCIQCGSDEIELWECGYSSFNPGGGRCRKCGREVQEMCSCNPTSYDLAAIWNKQNDIQARLKWLDSQINMLQQERVRLKKRLAR